MMTWTGLAARFPATAALIAMSTATTVLWGWAFDVASLRSVLPGAVEMKANTAVGLIFDAGALWVLAVTADRRWVRVARGAGMFGALIGVATLAEYVFGIDLGIDELLVQDLATAYNLHRGRMSPYTAIAFITTGVALLTLRRGGLQWPVRIAAGIVLVIGAVSALGYAWNVHELVTDRINPPVAIHTAVVFVLLGAGMFVLDDRFGHSRTLEVRREPVPPLAVLAFVFVLVLTIACGAYAYRALAYFDLASNTVEQHHRIESSILQLQTRASDAIGAQRSYLGTGDDIHRARYHARAADAKALAQTLQGGAVDKASLADLAAVDATLTRLLSTLESEAEMFAARRATAEDILKTGSAPGDRAALWAASEPVAARATASILHTHAEASRTRRAALASLLIVTALVMVSGGVLLRILQRNLQLRAEAVHMEQMATRVLMLLTSTHTREHAIGGTLEILAELVSRCSIAFYVPAAPKRWFARESAAGAHRDWPLRMDGAPCLPGTAVRSGAATGGAAAAGRDPARAGFACPVQEGDSVFGVMMLDAPRPLHAHETAFLTRQVAHLAVALSNIKHLRDLSDVSDQLARKSAALQSQAAELERANRLKSEFLATMSHELRTPLNAVIGFAEVLQDNLAGELNAEQREYVGDISASGEHLLALINDILDLSKVEAGKMELQPEPIDAIALVQSSLAMVREKAQARKIRMSFEPEPGLTDIVADSRKLKQIMYNLLSNAVKFSSDGGTVRVVAKREMDADGPKLAIAVADSGIGITAEDQARLFQPFVQIDSSPSKRFEGTGLGLALVRRLVELHGGSVHLTSVAGQGSTFTVRFPYAEPGAGLPPVASVPGLADSMRATPLVLVVEDQDRDAALLRAQLEFGGFTVVCARDAETGLKLARECNPDVITVDVLLPGMDGWDFLATVKADADLANIPVIVISIAADTRKGLGLGACSVLQKPIDRAELAAALAALSPVPRSSPPRRAPIVDADAGGGDLVAGAVAEGA